MKNGRHRRYLQWRRTLDMAKAFTLVELLVVLAIISLLAALLLPMLMEARRAAQAAACLSNQKQIYVGAMIFLSDNNQMLPPATNKHSPAIWLNDVNWGPKSLGPAGTRFDWATQFYGKYLNVPINGKHLGNFSNILYCPGGFRTKRGGANTSSYYSTGVTEIDYCLAGLSPTSDNDNINSRVGYTVYRAERFWQKRNDALGTVVFSFDQGTRDTQRQPHARSESNSYTIFGMNVIEADGRGVWKKPGEIVFYGWHVSFPTQIWAHPSGYRIPWYPIYDAINQRWGMRLANGASGSYYQDWTTNYGMVNVYVTD